MKVKEDVLGSHNYIPNSPYRLCGCKATVDLNSTGVRAQELWESQSRLTGLPHIPNSPYGLCGRKATLNMNSSKIRDQELCKFEEDVLGSHISQIVRIVSVDVKQH